MSEAFALAFQYLGRLLLGAPDAAFLETTRGLPEFLAAEGVFGPELAEDLSVAEDQERLVRTLQSDHLRLFSGPDPLAPPWESVWLEKDRLLFGQTTAEIAALYAGFGLSGGAGEPADHLGLELSFLGWLLANPGLRSSAGPTSPQAAALLLDEHLRKFAPQALAAAAKEAQTAFYRAVCAATLAALATFPDSP